MALYKKSDFVKRYGITHAFLSVYIKRGKVNVEDGYIDDSDRSNSDFILFCLDKQKLKKSNELKESPAEIGKENNNNTISIYEKNEDVVKKTGYKSKYELEQEKKALDIEKIQEEIDLLKKKNMKMDGESIPTEIVKALFSTYSKQITVQFYNSAEIFLNQISAFKKLSSAESSEMRGKLILNINEAVTNASKESKTSLSNIIKEYSNSKGIGEHD